MLTSAPAGGGGAEGPRAHHPPPWLQHAKSQDFSNIILELPCVKHAPRASKQRGGVRGSYGQGVQVHVLKCEEIQAFVFVINYSLWNIGNSRAPRYMH